MIEFLEKAKKPNFWGIWGFFPILLKILASSDFDG